MDMADEPPNMSMRVLPIILKPASPPAHLPTLAVAGPLAHGPMEAHGPHGPIGGPFEFI